MELMILLILFVLFFMNVPIGFALGMASLIVMWVTDLPLITISQKMFSGVDSFPLMAVPFFILAGDLMDAGGISIRIVRFADTLVGHIRGGLAHVAVMASMFFAGISGSSIADTAAVGSILIPAMEKSNYGKAYSASVCAAAGSVGCIIPPSIPMVVYGILGNVSIAALFLGGIIPGLLIGLSLMILAYLIARARGFESGKWRGFGEIWKGLRHAILALIMPGIIVGGIMGGVFTATESGAIAVVYGLAVGLLVFRKIRLRDLPQVFIRSSITTGMVMMIISTASIFRYLLTIDQVPQKVAEIFLSITNNPYVLFMLINVLLLVVGTFMDTLGALIILAPIFLPVVTGFGVDPVHFGVVVVINLAIGMATPPLGVCLFVACSIAKITVSEITRAVWPFLIVLIVVLFMVTYLPPTTLWIPRLVGF
ncbi:MAG: TRAP transporter large permease [Deltaproteobacteria bacterium]|nr:TRAP transporter large permease [Deltaproteobacteria bacterium]